MANEEQLAILKQGVEVWNKWREEYPDISIDLRKINLNFSELRGVNLSQADLGGTHLSEAQLSQSNLRGANLSETNLGQTHFINADLSDADLSDADLWKANLTNVNLTKANLTRAKLFQVNLSQANLNQADLHEANLSGANLSEALLHFTDLSSANLSSTNLYSMHFNYAKLIRSNFSKAQLDSAIFGYSDLSETIGLDEVVHRFGSQISTDVFSYSEGKIPEGFLRGCGLSDWEVEQVKLYNPNLDNEEVNRILYRIYDLRASQAIQISPLFISYSHGDGIFVDKLEGQLNKKGVRFWRDIHDMKSGRMETQIDRAIRQNPTVLLVLSEHSLESDWVEHEVRTARQLEKEMDRDVLCPVALDDNWKSSRWPKRVMEQVMEYNILDFSEWEDDSKFDGIFRKLIDGLELFYKG